MDRQGEVLIWCRKCWGCARQRVGTKLIFCCNPEQVGTEEYGKKLKRIQVLKDGTVPAKEVRKLEDLMTKEKNHKKRVPEASQQF